MAAFELQISTKPTWFITWTHSQSSQGVLSLASKGAGAGSTFFWFQEVDIKSNRCVTGERLYPARWLAHRQPIQCSTKKMLLAFAVASQISPRTERSNPRIVYSLFLSACLRKDTFKSWQWFENVLSLLWSTQNPLKEMAIFHVVLSGSQQKIALKMAEPFRAEEPLAGASLAVSPVALSCLPHTSTVHKHRENFGIPWQCHVGKGAGAILKP